MGILGRPVERGKAKGASGGTHTLCADGKAAGLGVSGRLGYARETVTQAISTRKSGPLSLFLLDAAAPDGGGLYARLHLRRGFLDDLNRILLIRIRIRIETEIAQGSISGRIEAAGAGPAFRWEFCAGHP